MKQKEGQIAEIVQVKSKIEQDRNIKSAPFKKDIRKTTPHRHDNYFEILYLVRRKISLHSRWSLDSVLKLK